jgi:hypothetical protein
MAKVYLYSSSLNALAIDGMSHLIDDAYLTDVPDQLVERYELVMALFENIQSELEFYKEAESKPEEDEDDQLS